MSGGIKILVYASPIGPRPSRVAPWPLRDEDGTTAVHMWNIGADYERRARPRAIAEQADIANAADLAHPREWHYGLRTHVAVAAIHEERAFYAEVFLSDQDRGLVYYFGLGAGPAHFREIVRRLNGNVGRRQTRRALRSLVSRGVVASEVRPVGRKGRSARIFTPLIPRSVDR